MRKNDKDKLREGLGKFFAVPVMSGNNVCMRYDLTPSGFSFPSVRGVSIDTP